MLSPTEIAALARKLSVTKDGHLDESDNRLEVAGHISSTDLEVWRDVTKTGASLGLSFAYADNVGESVDDIGEGFYRLFISKTCTEATSYFFSVVGFKKFLYDYARLRTVTQILVAEASAVFETASFIINPWTALVADDEMLEPRIDVRRYVRDFGSGAVPASIQDAILVSEAPQASSFYKTWREVAEKKLQVALSSQAWKDGNRLMLGLEGQRSVQFRMIDTLSDKAFSVATGAARWVYDDVRDTEARLILFTAELARDWAPDGTWNETVESNGGASLAAAQRAYRQQLVATSSETLKALGDFRKTLADEIASTMQATRDLVAGTWRDFAIALAALVAHENAITAKGSSSQLAEGVTHYVLVSVAIFLALSCGITLISNWRFNANLDALRKRWRTKLYSFLTEAEYEEFAAKPLKKTSRIYSRTAWLISVGYAALILLLLSSARSSNTSARRTKAVNPFAASTSHAVRPCHRLAALSRCIGNDTRTQRPGR